jgi:hypothetical protein
MMPTLPSTVGRLASRHAPSDVRFASALRAPHCVGPRARLRTALEGISPDWPQADRVAFDSLKSTKPVAWPWSAAPGAIGWVCKFAFVDRKASASDALREPRSQTLKLGDPLIDPLCPFAREPRPVLARGNAIGGKFGEFRADLLKRQPDPLGEDDKGDAAQHGSGITAMA